MSPAKLLQVGMWRVLTYEQFSPGDRCSGGTDLQSTHPSFGVGEHLYLLPLKPSGSLARLGS